MRKELSEVVKWLNKNYNKEDSEYYDVLHTTEPNVVRYNDHIAISLWACGAIVCIYDQMFFVCEDDEYWWVNDIENDEGDRDYGYQTGFSVAWADSFVNAMAELKKYVWENGTPVYFSGFGDAKIVCHYRLGETENEK